MLFAREFSLLTTHNSAGLEFPRFASIWLTQDSVQAVLEWLGCYGSPDPHPFPTKCDIDGYHGSANPTRCSTARTLDHPIKAGVGPNGRRRTPAISEMRFTSSQPIKLPRPTAGRFDIAVNGTSASQMRIAAGMTSHRSTPLTHKRSNKAPSLSNSLISVITAGERPSGWDRTV